MIDKRKLKSLIEVFEESSLNRLAVTDEDGTRVEMERHSLPVKYSYSQMGADDESDSGGELTADQELEEALSIPPSLDL